MERNENGYSSYNFAGDGARGAGSSCGCRRERDDADRDCGRTTGGSNNGSANINGGASGRAVGNGRSGGNGSMGGCAQGSHGGASGIGGGSPAGYGSMGGASGRLAMAYVPMQCWRMLYSPDYALTRGSLFEELDLPLEECTNG